MSTIRRLAGLAMALCVTAAVSATGANALGPVSTLKIAADSSSALPIEKVQAKKRAVIKKRTVVRRTPNRVVRKSVTVRKGNVIRKNVIVTKRVTNRTWRRGWVSPYRRAWIHRPWIRRPYYGRVIAGVALGTILVATAVAVAPRPPQDDLCWYWSNPNKSHGYWDYCIDP